MRRTISIWYFWITAWLYLSQLLALISLIGFVGWVAYTREISEIPKYGLAISAGIFVISGIGRMIRSSSVRCPLCRAELFKRLKCSRNEKVPHFLGSYRFPLAVSILRFADRIRCNCCGTSIRFSGESRQQNNEETQIRRPRRTVKQGISLGD